jgi:hypothetical protein
VQNKQNKRTWIMRQKEKRKAEGNEEEIKRK